MRILFTFAGGTGHFLPLVPLARAAERAGHVVAFAGQEEMVASVEAAGFTAFPSGGASLRAAGERTPLLPVDMEREARAIRVTFAGRIARERADAILALCEAWLPDLIVLDEIDFGAVVAAERLGLPHATVHCIASGSFVPNSLVAEPLNDLRASHELPPDPELAMLGRYLVLSPFPASFRDPAVAPSPNTHPFRPAGSDGCPTDRAGTAWLRALSKPLVYLTLGTIFNLESGDLFERVIAGLRGLPGNVVVTVGREVDPQSLGPQPANVHVRRYISQAELLPSLRPRRRPRRLGQPHRCVSHGLPLVLLPLGADQPLNAARAEQLRLARVLDGSPDAGGRGAGCSGRPVRPWLPAKRRAYARRDQPPARTRARAGAPGRLARDRVAIPSEP